MCASLGPGLPPVLRDGGVWVTGTQGNSQRFWAELETNGCDLSTGAHARAVGVRGGPSKCTVDTWCSQIRVLSAACTVQFRCCRGRGGGQGLLTAAGTAQLGHTHGWP